MNINDIKNKGSLVEKIISAIRRFESPENESQQQFVKKELEIVVVF